MGGEARESESRPMPATSSNRSIAARAGSWSARHKKTAIFGWIAFVLASLALGGAIGTKELKDTDTGAGDSGRADKIIDREFPSHSEESILVQSKDAGVRKAIVAEVDGVIERAHFTLTPSDVSRDGRSVLVQYE